MYEGEYINLILHDWLEMIEIDMGLLCVHVYVTNKMLDFTHQCRTGNFIWYLFIVHLKDISLTEL